LNAGELARFKREISRQKANGLPLRKQLEWRVERLTAGQTLDLFSTVEHFPELVDAFVVPGYETKLVQRDERGKPACKASLEDGGSIVITGYLHEPSPDGEAPGPRVGQFQRELQLDASVVIHWHLVIEPDFRGRGISLQLLRRSFQFYDELEMELVLIQAGLATGCWHWARVGFEFLPTDDCAKVKAWAVEVCGALGISGLNVDSYSSAGQFARMGGNRKVTFEELAAALPERSADLRELADENGLKMDERVALGRAVLLSGPPWRGQLDLKGPSRTAFEIYADSKEERMADEE
jgi:hypothetical protein